MVEFDVAMVPRMVPWFTLMIVGTPPGMSVNVEVKLLTRGCVGVERKFFPMPALKFPFASVITGGTVNTKVQLVKVPAEPEPLGRSRTTSFQRPVRGLPFKIASDSKLLAAATLYVGLL